MAQSRRGVVQILEAQTHPRIWTTPRLDWAIGFKGSKGICIWINFGIAFAIRCVCTSITWFAPRHPYTRWLNQDMGRCILWR
jgi:hypothetical protein